MKKKLFLEAVVLLFLMTITTSLIQAQLKKGNYLVETNFGNIGFGSNHNQYETAGVLSNKSDETNFSFNLYPRIGFFLSDNFVLGTELDFYFYNSNNNNFNNTGVKTTDNKSSSFSLGLLPFARVYFGSSSDGKSMFYGQLSGGINFELADNYDSKSYNASGVVTSTYKYDYTKKYNSFSGNVMVGWTRFISENVALNFNLGYKFSKSSYTYKYIQTVGGVNTTSPEYKSANNNSGLTWNMGFSMIIPGGKTK